MTTTLTISQQQQQQLSIRIDGGGPYGFRLFGGEGDPLTIAKLRQRSKAWEAGLEEGDELLTINDHNCRNISHATAMSWLTDGPSPFVDLRVLRKGGKGGPIDDSQQMQRCTGNRQRSLTPGTTFLGGMSQSLQPPLQPVTNTTKPYIHVESSFCRSKSPADDTCRALHSHPIITGYAINSQMSRPAQVLKWSPMSASTVAVRDERGNSQTELTDHLLTKKQSGSSPYELLDANLPSVSSYQKQFNATRTDPSRSSAKWQPSWQREKSSSSSDTWNASTEMGTDRSPFNSPYQPSVIGVRSNPLLQSSPTSVPSEEVQKSDICKSSFELSFNKTEQLASHESKEDGDFVNCNSNSNLMNFSTNINKILKASFVTDGDLSSCIPGKEKKKVFCDSSFYDDPKHRYPTVNEQIKMARQVALSLTSPVNASARGHQMFIKRKERSDKYIVDSPAVSVQAKGNSTADGEDRLYYNPTPWSACSTWKAPRSTVEGMEEDDHLPPITTSKLFAPKISSDDEKSKALSSQEFERLRLYSQKASHSALSPQVAFRLAHDLERSNSKGGRMFAKRRAMSEELEPKSAPDPKILQKISSGFELKKMADRETGLEQEVVKGVCTNDLPPVNRLKDMIELPKPKMTPWDAVFEYGDVDVAFEHLGDYWFCKAPNSNPFADKVASSLQHVARQRQTPAGAQRYQTTFVQNKWNLLPQDIKPNTLNGPREVKGSSPRSTFNQTLDIDLPISFQALPKISNNSKGKAFSDL